MFLNKRFECSILDIVIGYGCAAYLFYVVGRSAYNVGKTNGKKEFLKEAKEAFKK